MSYLDLRLRFALLSLLPVAASAALLAGCPAGENPPATTCDPPCAGGTVCQADTNTCVPAGSTDLGAPTDLAAATCSPPCPANQFCNQNRQCVACLADTDCPPGSVCRTTQIGASCVPGCAGDARCPNGQKCCDGACSDVTKDLANCGACGMKCVANHARPTCNAGQCAAGSCDPGWGDCNMNGADGCETNLRSDAANCTACGNVCAIQNAINGCADGCYMRACTFGYDDCNQDEKDGCETSVLSDVKNCGSCGQPCNNPAHAKASCVSANCIVTACDQGWGDCNINGKDGCETPIASDAKNCGKCGFACPLNQVCVNGGCTCMQCNIPNATTKCVNNVCTFDACVAGYADCNNNVADGCEVNLNADAKNCGKCGQACAMGLVCSSGTCKMIACQNLGWKFGSSNWTCPNGLRMPTVAEWNNVAPCVTAQDQAKFSYYHDVAVSVGGCNCKWNGAWCGQPSIETIRGGRMCGDYDQLHICVN